MRKLISIFFISFSLSASMPAIASESQSSSADENDQNLIDVIFGGMQNGHCRDYPKCLQTEEQQMIEDAEQQEEVYQEELDSSTAQPN